MDVLKVALPAILNNVVMILTEVINNVFIGNIDEPAKLAGVGLATMTVNLVGLAITFGFNTAMEAHIQHALQDGRPELCGLTRNRGKYLVTLLFFPIICLLLPGRQVLIMLGQSQSMALYFQEYVFAFLPVAYMSCICDCQLRLLSNFGKTRISYACSAIGIVVHLLGCWITLSVLNMGIYGTAVSGTVAYLVMYCVMLAYGSFQDDLKNVLVFPDRTTFCCPVNGLWDYIKISGRTTTTTILDCFAWELMLLQAGFLTVDKQASQ